MSFIKQIRTVARCGGSAAVLLAGAIPAIAAKTPPPTVKLPLAALGFPGYPVALMHAGASMATIHVLDNTHLLFTYGLRSLVPRLPGDDENDHDRMVGAEVIEVPSGKILARTEWHLHDYGRYLFNVGHGVFVLRSGDDLSVLTPLRGLPNGTAFQRTALPHRPGHPELVGGSPDGEIVTIELQRKPDDTAEGDEQPRRKHTTIEFYRLVLPSDAKEPIELHAAGVVGSPGLLRLALDGDGYLWAEDAAQARWSVSFEEFQGKGQNLTAIDSSCSPRMDLLSRSQFAVISCRGSDDVQALTVYGFDGHENWEQHFGESLEAPAFVAAPAAGRFAMSRLSATSTTSLPGLPGDNGTLSQEIRVYGTISGELLLALQCVPAARTPENFDLSPEGKTLAVLGSDSINLYTLPELSQRDRLDLQDAASMMPPSATGPVVLRRITRPVAEEQAVTSEETTAPQPSQPRTVSGDVAASATIAKPGDAEAPAVAAATPTPPAQMGSVGDTPGPRKPPTLLAPGEQPEYKTPENEKPN